MSPGVVVVQSRWVVLVWEVVLVVARRATYPAFAGTWVRMVWQGVGPRPDAMPHVVWVTFVEQSVVAWVVPRAIP